MSAPRAGRLKWSSDIVPDACSDSVLGGAEYFLTLPLKWPAVPNCLSRGSKREDKRKVTFRDGSSAHRFEGATKSVLKISESRRKTGPHPLYRGGGAVPPAKVSQLSEGIASAYAIGQNVNRQWGHLDLLCLYITVVDKIFRLLLGALTIQQGWHSSSVPNIATFITWPPQRNCKSHSRKTAQIPTATERKSHRTPNTPSTLSFSLAKHSFENSKTDVNSAELSTGQCKRSSQPDFYGRCLRDVYEYHIGIRDRDQTVHPLYFIVADQADWTDKGVLTVFLANNVNGDENQVGVGRCGVEMADSWGANLSVGNQDWMDFKEEEETEWGGEDPYPDDGDDSNEGDGGFGGKESGGSRAAREKWKFGWYSLVVRAVPITRLLEPGWMDRDSSQRHFQMLGNYTPLPQPWDEISTMHPRFCLDRPDVHRQLIAVVGKQDADTADGVAIVRLDWDGSVEALNEDSSQEVKPQVTVIKRTKAGEALTELESIASN